MKCRRNVVPLALLATLFLANGCNRSPNSAADPAASGGSSSRIALNGAGSTFIGPIMAHWIAEYDKSHPDVLINYRPAGSGKGIQEFQRHRLNFGVTDAPLNDDQLSQMFPTIQIPVAAGAVCIIYNLPGLNIPLRLSPDVLAGIYLGSIVSWQDPLLTKDNPGLHLPAAPIIVVHRADGSGTTNILTTYLSKVSREWSLRIGHGTSVAWPRGFAVNGSEGVADVLKHTSGTIGYAELGYATTNGLTVASIQNRSGTFRSPDEAGVTASINAFQLALTTDVRTPIVDPPATAKDAYPIAGLSYLLLAKENMNGKGTELVQFINYVLGDGQLTAMQLSYSPLPEFLKQCDFKLISTSKSRHLSTSQ